MTTENIPNEEGKKNWPETVKVAPPTKKPENQGFFKNARIGIKLLIIGILSLILLIPIPILLHFIDERDSTAEAAKREIYELWGEAQYVVGPVLHIPANSSSKLPDIYILPEELNIQGNVVSEKRSRGIYDAMVYTADLDLDGTFVTTFLPEDSLSQYNLEKTEILVSLNDIRGLTDNVTFNFNGKDYKMKVCKDKQLGTTLHCTVPMSEIQEGEPVQYSTKLMFRGSEKLNFMPLGNVTEVNLTSNCASPSFQGNSLPITRTVSDTGFTATWKTLAINRDFEQKVYAWDMYSYYDGYNEDYYQYNKENICCKSNNEFGVELKVPVLQYQQTTRSVKYAYLFIFLTFATVFFVEQHHRTKIHPIQYLLIGIALIMFYTLLLSFCEHIPFLWAYIIAMLMTNSLITAYLAGILKIRKTALLVGLLLTVLYIFIYILLQLETYALLTGSIGLFIILAVLMYASQKVKWYQQE